MHVSCQHLGRCFWDNLPRLPACHRGWSPFLGHIDPIIPRRGQAVAGSWVAWAALALGGLIKQKLPRPEPWERWSSCWWCRSGRAAALGHQLLLGLGLGLRGEVAGGRARTARGRG